MQADTTLAPTDAEIEALRDAFDWDGWTCPKSAQRAFARAVFEKWGAPTPASGEPTPEQVALLDPWMRPAAARELLTKVLALGAAPPAQEVRVPLKVEQIQRIYDRYGGDMVNCTRSIERHHGITAAQKETP